MREHEREKKEIIERRRRGRKRKIEGDKKIERKFSFPLHYTK